MSDEGLQIESGDTAWLLTSSALVMFMTPGLGFFYGGMVNKKNMLSTIAYCFVVFAMVSVIWFLIGFTLVFGETAQGQGFIGNLKYGALEGVGEAPSPLYASTIPFILFCFFQLKFAGITPALIIGSMVERIKFQSLLLFVTIWMLVVYCPIAHWFWNAEGWCFKMGALDFAGGNVVHISSGFAGLAAAIVLGKRQVPTTIVPSNISFILLGTALLWFGWFGFNGGSALTSSGLASLACMSTNLSAACAGLTWMFWELIFKGKASIIGFAAGSVCGLVGITPGCGFVPVWSSLIIGIGSGTFSFLFCHYKTKFIPDSIEDTLDVFGCHGVSGVWGGIALGLFAKNGINPTIDEHSHDGAFFGYPKLLGIQIAGILASAAWSFFLSIIILYIIEKTIGMRVSLKVEEDGLDLGIFDHAHAFEEINMKKLDAKIEQYLNSKYGQIQRIEMEGGPGLNGQGGANTQLQFYTSEQIKLK